MHLSNLITRSQENKTTWATFFFFFSKRLFRQKCLSLIIWEDKRLFKTNLKKEAKLEEMLKIETIWPYSKVILYCTRLKISYSFSTISVYYSDIFGPFFTFFELSKTVYFMFLTFSTLLDVLHDIYLNILKYDFLDNLLGHFWHYLDNNQENEMHRTAKSKLMDSFYYFSCGTWTSSSSTRSHPTGGTHRALRRPSDLNLRPLPRTHHHPNQNWTFHTILGFMRLSLHFRVRL